MSRLDWRKDSRTVAFEYNQRGHQAYPRHRSRRRDGQAARGHLRRAEDLLRQLAQVQPRREERRPGNHLDVGARRLEPPLSVRRRSRTGEEPDHARASGWSAASSRSTKRSGRSGSARAACIRARIPYFMHYYRINFDGTGLTHADRCRRAATTCGSRPTWSTTSTPTRASICRPSRSCAAPSDRSLVATLEKADISALARRRLEGARGVRRQGARRQDRHLGRHRPADELRPEEEVSGHREHLRRAAQLVRAEDVLAVRPALLRRQGDRHAADGRARLHRRADRRHGHVEPLEGVPRRRWKNLGDAGFPDRILWHKAVAAKYPYYDVTRVGIYGGSAGGQNSIGGLLFHPDFYKVAVSLRRLPRQPHGQDRVERAVDGLAARRALRRVVERRQRVRGSRASCCWSSASWTRTSIRRRRCRS